MSRQIFRAQVSSHGTVWMAEDHDNCFDTGLSPEAFVSSGLLPNDNNVTLRLLGRADNAELIEQLHTAKSTFKFKVQLGNPAVGMAERRGVRSLLESLWYVCTSRDMFGQWYELGEGDYPVYALVAAVRKAGGPCDKARRLLQYHPAWPAFSFIPSHAVDACVTMAATIVDARWYTNPHRPHRSNRLYQFLGLDPQNVQLLIKPFDTVPRRNLDRAENTITAWLGYSPKLICDVGIGGSLGPGDFLRRVFASTETDARGVLGATRRFVHFVREVWVSERASVKGCFLPESFFKGYEEIEAYKQHYMSLHGTDPAD